MKKRTNKRVLNFASVIERISMFCTLFIFTLKKRAMGCENINLKTSGRDVNANPC